MQKRFLTLYTLVMLLFFMFSATAFAEANNTKKVFIHYHRLDGVYDEVGVWTWNNGTNGSADGIAKTGVDAFGAVIEITVGADAEANGSFIPLKKEMPQ
ncbi:MAG: pullulanase-associated domain-containing protein, partial [Bacillota bacterium]